MKETIVTLKKNWEFRRVFKRGKKFFSRYMVVYYARNGLCYNRYGISVSKKVGNSVIRHRVKRLFIEVFRRLQKESLKGYDFIIIAKKNTVYMEFYSCRNDVIKVLQRESLLEKTKRGKT